VISKSFSKSGQSCRVTFKLGAEEAQAETVAVLGEFNDWDPKAHALTRRKDGGFSATFSLPAGREYRFRYLLDGTRWTNDAAADRQVPNRYGGEDSLLVL
jgi:1,4-alpha-glucan branching enzyme